MPLYWLLVTFINAFRFGIHGNMPTMSECETHNFKPSNNIHFQTEKLSDSRDPIEADTPSNFVMWTSILNLTQLSNYLTLEGSFSAVATARIARKDTFCSIFRDLQYLQTFAPLQIQNFSSPLFLQIEY